MDSRSVKMDRFAELIDKYAVGEEPVYTAVNNFIIGKTTKTHKKKPMVYEPAVIFAAKGRKNIYLEGKRFDYFEGNFMTLFLPMPLECEVVEASPENPMLLAGLAIDQSRLSSILMKIEIADSNLIKPEHDNTSGIFSAPISERMLDTLIRLLETLSDPVEAKVLGESIVDEIYYRILTEEQGGALKYLLLHRGQIQQISRAVEYVQENMEKTVTIDEMADIVNMSSSGFHRKFKEVMHLSPLQYIKSMKLNKAKTLITEGLSVSEAGYMVGYNSPAQFSREFKRFFGFVPSSC